MFLKGAASVHSPSLDGVSRARLGVSALGFTGLVLGLFLADTSEVFPAAAPHPSTSSSYVTSGAAQQTTTPKNQTISGTVITALASARPNQPHERKYAVLAQGRLYEINPTHKLLAGQRVELDPAAEDGPKLVAKKRAQSILMDSTAQRTTLAPAPTIRRVTVALAAPRGHTPDATTPGEVADAINHQAAAFWAQQTHGLISHTVAQTHDWISLATSCSQPFDLWGDVAEKIGWRGEPGSSLMVYLPESAYTECGAGLGTVGDADIGALAYTSGPLRPDIITHELGHNLGLGHANLLSCSNPTAESSFRNTNVPAGCKYTGYGDYSDTMGASHGHLGSISGVALQRLGMGSPPEEYLRSNATITLKSSDRPESITIAAPNGQLYFAEYRAPVGREKWLRDVGVTAGVQIRRNDPRDEAGSLLLDATPTGNPNDYDTGLKPGRQIALGNHGVRLRVLRQDAAEAVLQVTFPGIKQKAANVINIG